MKNTISEMKNTLEGINIRSQIRDLEDKITVSTHSEY